MQNFRALASGRWWLRLQTPYKAPSPLRISGYAPDWKPQAKLLDVLFNDIMRKAKK